MEYEGSVLREGLYFGECPRWHDGRLWYSDFYDHAVHALAPDGADERVVEVPGQPAGLGWMPDGSLLIVSMLDRRVLRLGLDGALAEHADLREWAPFHCNDMVVDAAGRAYVGNFGYDVFALLAGEPVEPRPTVLIRIDPDGQVSVAADDLEFPNGTVITPDGRRLIVAESGGLRLSAFDISADGELSNRRVWADLEPHQIRPDGICLDASGAVWVASPAGMAAVAGRRGGRAAGYGQVLPALYCLHARRTRRPRAVRDDRAHVDAGGSFRVRAGADRVSPCRRRPRRPSVACRRVDISCAFATSMAIPDHVEVAGRLGRGTVRGTGRRIIPARRAPSMQWPMLLVQLAHAEPGSMPLVMRRSSVRFR